ICLHLHMWWSFWVLRGVADWNYLRFVYVLIGPGVLVIASHIIIPEMIDGRIDVERYYFDIAPIFFVFLTAASAWSTLLDPLMGLRPFLPPFRLLQLAALATFVSCSVTKNRKVHVVGLVTIVVLLVVSIAWTRFSLEQLDLRRP